MYYTGSTFQNINTPSVYNFTDFNNMHAQMRVQNFYNSLEL